MIAGFLICLALALTIGATLAICAVIAGARYDHARPLPGALGSSWPELDAWEEHVRTTPGLTDLAIEACDVALWEMEMGADA